MKENSLEKITFLMEQVLLTKESCKIGIDFSVAEKRADLTAMFMEYDRIHFHRDTSAGSVENSQERILDLSLELEDW